MRKQLMFCKLETGLPRKEHVCKRFIEMPPAKDYLNKSDKLPQLFFIHC